MQTITNSDKVVQVIGRWHPGDMAFVRSLYYIARGGLDGAELEIEFLACRRDTATGGWPSDGGPKYRVRIKFSGVQDLQLKDFGGRESQVMGFDIVDISDRGWEGSHYLVEDYEDGRISFRCAAVEVIEAEALPHG